MITCAVCGEPATLAPIESNPTAGAFPSGVVYTNMVDRPYCAQHKPAYPFVAPYLGPHLWQTHEAAPAKPATADAKADRAGDDPIAHLAHEVETAEQRQHDSRMDMLCAELRQLLGDAISDYLRLRVVVINDVANVWGTYQGESFIFAFRVITTRGTKSYDVSRAGYGATPLFAFVTAEEFATKLTAAVKKIQAQTLDAARAQGYDG